MTGNDVLANLSLGYWLTIIVIAGLVIEAVFRWQQKWAVPALMVYVTVIGWYVLEPVYSPDTLAEFSADEINTAFYAVIIFLVAFRISCIPIILMMKPLITQKFDAQAIPAEQVLKYNAILWILLLAIGVARLNGDVVLALFPVDARAGNSMWLRAGGADAGPFGFLISSASYLYILVLAAFGMLLPFLKTRQSQLFCIALIAISWPYAFLQGSRNVTLAVFIPLVFSYLFFSNTKVWMKISIIAFSGIFIDYAMRTILAFRKFGFAAKTIDVQDIQDKGYAGLNMASELVHCIAYTESGVLRQTWGMGLVYELGNIIPRAIWSDKPLLGIDYALARGFGGGDGDTGVVATISTGMIGQGVLEFGFIGGPIFVAILMALWCGLLARLHEQGTIARVCLFLFGMGLTFNLGRNITMLVLWPMLFAYIAVILLERAGARKAMRSAPIPGELSDARPE